MCQNKKGQASNALMEGEVRNEMQFNHVIQQTHDKCKLETHTTSLTGGLSYEAQSLSIGLQST